MTKIKRIPWNKGRTGIYTIEQRKKISDTLKAKGIRPPSQKGVKASIKTRRKLSKFQKGRKRSLQNRINSSIGAKRRVRNGNHNFWRGGITPDNKTARNSFRYRIWREAVMKRDNYTCSICDIKNTKGLGKTIYLNAHHIENFSNIKEKRYELDNGITMCNTCHKLFHIRYGKNNNTINQLISFISNK
jgi:predicted HNH restriction endonuclease